MEMGSQRELRVHYPRFVLENIAQYKYTTAATLDIRLSRKKYSEYAIDRGVTVAVHIYCGNSWRPRADGSAMRIMWLL